MQVTLILSLMFATIGPVLLTIQPAEASHIANAYSTGGVLMNGPVYCSVNVYTGRPNTSVNWEVHQTSSNGQYPSESIQLTINDDRTYLIWFSPSPQRGGVLARGTISDIQGSGDNFRIMAEESYGKRPVFPRPVVEVCTTRSDTQVPATITGKCDANAYVDYESQNSIRARFIGVVKCIPGEHEPPPIEGTTEPFPPPGTENSTALHPVQ